MNELNQGVGALRRAAGHFALGTAESITPTYDRARSAANRGWDSTRDTLNPIYHSLRERAMQARVSGALGGQMMMPAAMSKSMAKGPGRKARKRAAQHKSSKMRGLVGLLAAGAAVGAAGAAV